MVMLRITYAFSLILAVTTPVAGQILAATVTPAPVVTTTPVATVTPVAGAVTTTPATTTPVATVTPLATLRRYTEGKDAFKDHSNLVYLGVGGLLGVSVVMIVQGARSKMRSAVAASNMEASNSDCEEGEARLLSSLK